MAVTLNRSSEQGLGLWGWLRSSESRSGPDRPNDDDRGVIATQAEPGNPPLSSPLTTVTSDTDPSLAAIMAALQRLDQLLEWAVAAMHGSAAQPVSASWSGLYIDQAEVGRLLARTPGESPFTGERPPEERRGTADTPLNRLIQTFQLSPFDVDVILLALAPELDLRYERLYAYLQDDITRKRPTVELALNLLCSTVEDKLARRSRLEGGGPLTRHELLHIVPDPNHLEAPFLAHYLKVDAHVVRYILGEPGVGGDGAEYCQLLEPPPDWNGLPDSAELKWRLPALLHKARANSRPLLMYFRGAPGTGKRKAAESLAGTIGVPLLVVDLNRFADVPDFGPRLGGVLRDASLRGCLLYLSGFDALRAETRTSQRDLLQHKLEHHPATAIVSGSQPWSPGAAGLTALTVPFEIPEFETRRECWHAELDAVGSHLESDDLDALAGRFRLTAAQIKDAVTGAVNSSQWRDARDAGAAAPPTTEDVYDMARAAAGDQLAKLSRKIHPRQGWDDIVLPQDQLDQLREICLQAQFRHVVYDAWGFDRKLSAGKGLNILFFGPPGTGKSMSAEVIARELRLDLYRVDLSQIVSKYIGETEKNLDQIFTAAENSNAILFFDEADALFGKRSEVRDAHDRYANLEISYLLQKMEEYQGVSILATNLRQNLDEAFVRRLQAIVEFPFPDEEYRRRIWELAFPPAAPVGDDVQFDLLAREIRLAGGNIKNMALAAAFFAAAGEGTIHMTHLLQAARREHQKLGRGWSDAAFRPLAESSYAG
jgi:AAA+ superfamily predicted ATPase